jgi:hypothetical protein
MRKRVTSENKNKAIIIKVTEGEHEYIKISATERRLSMSRLILEALRTYLKGKN